MKRSLIFLLACLLTVCCLPIGTVTAAETYIYDEVGLLSDTEALEARAAELSEQYGCGVYLAILEDYYEYGYSVENAAETYYSRRDLGWGEEKSGILLLLSMDDRDYDLLAFGYGNYAFTDYGKDRLAEYFLSDLAANDWDDGAADYLTGCMDLLELAAQGEPLDVVWDDYDYDDPFYDDAYFYGDEWYYEAPGASSPKRSLTEWLLLLVALPCGLSMIVCLILKAQLRSVKQAKNAEGYASGRILLTRKQEIYLHTTHSRTKVASSNHSSGGGGGGHHGGTSVSSGGFSHHSGKF